MNLRDNGIITERQYIGSTLEEATKFAEEGGFEVRVVEIDGNAKIKSKGRERNQRLRGIC